MFAEKETLISKSVLIAALFALSAVNTQLLAAGEQSDKPLDLFEMTLEQLMMVEIGEVNPMGIYHTHEKGEFMVGYSASFIDSKGNRSGTSHVSTSQVLQDFMVAPTKITTSIQMFELMYTPTDKTTIMTTLPYIRKSMDHINRSGVKFDIESQGPGDLRSSILHSIYQNGNHLIYVSGGLSFPTGSVSKRDTTPTGRGRLSYPMQLGSGTWDLLPGVAYLGKNEKWSWGAHLGGVIRLGRNTHRYRLGDEFKSTIWLTRNLSDQLSTRVRIDSMIWDDIHGADPALNPLTAPTEDPDLRGGDRTDIGFGINLLGKKGAAEGHRLSVEYRIPLYQSLHGPQLETDWILSVGWQILF